MRPLTAALVAVLLLALSAPVLASDSNTRTVNVSTAHMSVVGEVVTTDGVVSGSLTVSTLDPSALVVVNQVGLDEVDGVFVVSGPFSLSVEANAGVAGDSSSISVSLDESGAFSVQASSSSSTRPPRERPERRERPVRVASRTIW